MRISFMLCTSLVDFDKKRVKVFLDEEFAFVLYKGELNLYGIKTDQILKEENYHEIVRVVLVKRAKLRAANLVAKREYTQKQIEDKLSQGGYPSSCIEAAITFLLEYHYLDDERYARNYLLSRVASKSRKQLVMELKNKGIEMDTIETVFEEANVEGDTEEKAVRLLLKKRKFDFKTATYEEREKMKAFLFRRGFPSEIIRNEVNSSQYDEEYYGL